MEDVKILSLIPESLHPELIKEVETLIKEKEQQKAGIINPDIKNFVTKKFPTKQKK